MQAKRLFAHSIRQVFGNLGAAVRISGVLYLIQWVVTLVLGMTAAKDIQPVSGDQAAMAAALKGLFGPALLALTVLLFTDFWVAVAWHRYVLKEEMSRGILPLFVGRRILGYFGTALAIGGMLIVPALLISTLVGGTIRGALGTSFLPTLVSQVLSQTLLGAFAFRMSAVLAGVALEPGHKLSEAWQATEGETVTFLELAFYCALALAAADIAGSTLFSGVLVLQIAYNFVAQWVITMVGISILTTLYGHYVQKRPLV